MSRKGGVACVIESLLFKMWEEMRRCRKERKGIEFCVQSAELDMMSKY